MIYNFDELKFQPISIGNFVHEDGFFDVKARPFSALSICTAGKKKFEIGTKTICVNQGDIIFMPANISYKAEYADCESIVAHFDGCNYFEAEKINLTNKSLIEKSFQKLLECWNQRHSVNQAKSIVFDILDKISSDTLSVSPNSAFTSCVSYLEDNFSDPELDITKIHKFGFMSASTLQRKFTEHFKLSPKQYLTRLRMNKALDLLISGKLSISEISLQCGFTDDKYFSRAFKKEFGHPPSQMKNYISK